MRNILKVSAVALVAVGALSGAAFADVAVSAGSTMSTPRDFKAEKGFMVDDLTDKLSIVVDVRACAMRADNIEQLDECSAAFREAILRKQKGGK